jgi:hypothetical protein
MLCHAHGDRTSEFLLEREEDALRECLREDRRREVLEGLPSRLLRERANARRGSRQRNLDRCARHDVRSIIDEDVRTDNDQMFLIVDVKEGT